MSDWEVKTLDQIVELRRGFDLPHHSRRPGQFPVLTSGATAGWHDEGPVTGPGMVIGRATNLGEPTWSDTDYWPLNTTLYVADFRGNEPKWVFHLFESLDLTGYDSGSVQPMLNRNYIAKVSVRVPPLQTQRSISEVLGALSDKINANTKLAQVSVELASLLFRDELRTALWSDRTFDDLAKVSGGGTPSTRVAEYWDGDVNWATPTDVTGLDGPYLWETTRRITKAGLSACSSALFEPGAILMTSRATIGAFAVAQLTTSVNQGFIVVQPKDALLKWWLFHEMRSRVEEFISLANGATFLELSRGNFRKLKVRLAEESAMREFGVRVDSLHAAASSALNENRTLAATRDALLPQLMSGKLRVRDAEKVLEGVL